uniref:Uncharacterized protein n=1 Tax=Candidatus Kentrum sp. TC TaxID=2126339 RepID=A0A450YSN4_9GAMM|nr:MAG: hypothetical protein BECKTC1821E_GA0114239_103634 [Candidatus Kentron sp. TC]
MGPSELMLGFAKARPNLPRLSENTGLLPTGAEARDEHLIRSGDNLIIPRQIDNIEEPGHP